MSNALPPFIRVDGQLYRLAGKVSDDVVKDSISKAADKAAIQNIVDNLVSHANDIASVSPNVFSTLDDKDEADKLIETLFAHADVLHRFLNQLRPTYNRYHSKEYDKKSKKTTKDKKDKK